MGVDGLGFLDKIKKTFESKEKKKARKIEKITSDLSQKQKLPKKESYKYKESVKPISAKYHHIVKIYFVRDYDDLDDDTIDLMIKFVKKYKDRFIAKEINKAIDYTNEPKLKDMFKTEFETELFIEIITLASERKRLTINELWQYSQEFLDTKAKNDGSAKAILVGLTKMGLVKNELQY